MKIIFFIGKGGVGKSTLSSLTAFKLAKMNYQVHLMSIDPAHNLNDIFYFSEYKFKEKIKNSLTIEEVNLDKWMETYIKKVKEQMKYEYKYLTAFNIENLLDIIKFSPGIQEYAVLSAFYEIIEKFSTKDFIIFDTPPTALTLRILSLPQISMTWLNKLIKIREKILSRRLSIANVYGENEFKKLSSYKIAFKKEEDQVYLRLKTLFEKNKHLFELFTNPEKTIIIPVLNQDTLSFKETERIVQYLRKFNINIPCFIINKYKGIKSSEEKLIEKFKKPVYTIKQKEEDFFINVSNFELIDLPFINKLN